MRIPRYRPYTEQAFKREIKLGLLMWLAIAAIWYVAGAGITVDWEKALEAVLSSLSLTILWHAIRYATGNQVEHVVNHVFDKLPRTRVVIQEQSVIDTIKSARPLWMHYTDMLSKLQEQMNILVAGRPILIDPYSLYTSILSCAANCERDIISVDCDIGAWFYICEPEDFDFVFSHDPEQSLIKKKNNFKKERRERSRTDFTYKLSKILMSRLDLNGNFTLSGHTPLRRVFIVHSTADSITPKDRMVINRIKIFQKHVKRRMSNRILFLPDLDSAKSEIIDIIKMLQDIVIFDQKVAFKEYLLDPEDARREQSEIIIHDETIQEFERLFKTLYNDHSIDIFDVDLGR